MSESNNLTDTITIDHCREYISEHIFKLRPDQYKDDHPIWPGAVGLEVEMLPVVLQKGGGLPALVPLQGRTDTLASCLRTLAEKRGWKYEEDTGPDSTGPLLIRVLMDRGDALTFEPGGQLEFSSIPYPCLGDAVVRLNKVQEDLVNVLDCCDVKLMQVGNNPFYGVKDVGLQMPKLRYRAMDQHFEKIGPWGQKMMRLTCTLQVCLDFGPHETIMAQRYLLSQLLAPFATAIFANSPFAEGKDAGHVGYRSLAWRHLDPSRTGIPKGLESVAKNLDKASCVEVYTQMLLDSQVVFVESLNFKRPDNPTFFRDWMETPIDGVSPTEKELETQLSLMFPEVRPRNFLELRSLDCQAVIWQIVPAAFYTGILYDDQNLIECIEMLTPYINRLDELLLKAGDGLADPEICEISKRIMSKAVKGFERLPSCFLNEGSLKKLSDFEGLFTSKGRTPADDLLDEFKKRNEDLVSFELFETVEKRWQELQG